MHANVLALLRRWEEAAKRYADAAKLDPGNARYAIEQAKCLQALGRHEAALVALGAASSSDADGAEIHMAIGDSLRALNRNSEAVAAYKKFLELDRADSIYRGIAQAWITELSG